MSYSEPDDYIDDSVLNQAMIDYINKINPDLVITEIVERFMPIVPNDKFNLRGYVKNKLKILQNY